MFPPLLYISLLPSLADILLHVWCLPWPIVATPLLNSCITQANIPTDNRTNGPANTSRLNCLAVRHFILKKTCVVNISLYPELSKADQVSESEKQRTKPWIMGIPTCPWAASESLKSLFFAKSVPSRTGFHVTNLKLKWYPKLSVTCVCGCVCVHVWVCFPSPIRIWNHEVWIPDRN